jgi:hypothetical protein
MFKWTFLFVASAWVVSQVGRDMGIVCVALIAAVDVAIQVTVKVNDLNTRLLHEKLWLDELSTRLFYEEFVNRLRAGDRPDVGELYKASSKRAVTDITEWKADNQIGLFWTFAAATWTFVWQWIGYLIYYGGAFALGSALR